MKKQLFQFVILIFIIPFFTSCGPNHSKSSSSDDSDSISSSNPSVEKDIDSSSLNRIADATLDVPASVDQWIQSMRYSAVTGNYHTIYYRIKEIRRSSDDPSILDILHKYNEEGHATSFRLNNNNTLEYGLIYYEVLFPKDFPESDDGLISVDIPLKIDNLKGENYYVEKNDQHYDQSIVTDISPKPEPNTLHSGHIFRYGLAVFEIPIEEKDYIIDSTFFLGNSAFSTYTRGE